MWKEHIALHLHVKNSVRLHQAEAWMISFFWHHDKGKKSGLSSTRVCWKEQLISWKKKMIKTHHQWRCSSSGNLGDKNWKPHGPTRDQNVRKEQWTELHNQKSDKEFSEMRINRTTFNLLLNTLWDRLVLTPTNFVLEPNHQIDSFQHCYTG